MTSRSRAVAVHVGLALSLGALGGCGRYVRVRSELIQSGRVEAPQVRPTETFHQVFDRIKTVALQPPARCLPRTSASTVLLPGGCQVLVETMEGALKRGGYAVESWSNLWVKTSRQQSYLEAARSLGVDVVLEVAGFSSFPVHGASEASWRRRYDGADSSGIVEGPALLVAEEKQTLDALMRHLELDVADGRDLGVHLRLEARWVESGDVIWSYESRRRPPPRSDDAVTILVEGSGARWRLVRHTFTRDDMPIPCMHLIGEAGGSAVESFLRR